MTQNPKNTGHATINLGDQFEIKYWTTALGVTRDELEQAVNSVGSSVESVKAYLGLSTDPEASRDPMHVDHIRPKDASLDNLDPIPASQNRAKKNVEFDVKKARNSRPDTVEDIIERAELYLDAGNLLGAELTLKFSLKEFPENKIILDRLKEVSAARAVAENRSDVTDSAESSSPGSTADQGPTRVESIASDDLLERGKITNALVQLILERTGTDPFAIGLFGAWGSGKSSQVEFVKRVLRSSSAPRFKIAEFNAWQHEKCENLGAALAQAVVESLVRDLSFSAQGRLSVRLSLGRSSKLLGALSKDVKGIYAALTKFTHVFAPLFVPAVAVGMLSYPLIHYITSGNHAELGAVGLSAATLALTLKDFVSKNLTEWFKNINSPERSGFFRLPDFTAKLGSFHELHHSLKQLCELCLQQDNCGPKEGEYLFLVVDDLDRCSPQAVKQVFDAVRLVAHIPRVVTLVALDERIAFAAVEKHFDQFASGNRDASQVARDYLAKVFQASITLPLPKENITENYVRCELFKASQPHDHPEAPAPSDGVTPPAGELEQQNDTQPLANEPVAVEFLDEEIDLFVRLAVTTGISNPRQLWRLKQAWFLLKGLVLTHGARFPAMEPWMRSLFFREWLLQAPNDIRRRIEGAKRAGTTILFDGENTHFTKEIADLCQDEDMARWESVDIVLLPAS